MYGAKAMITRLKPTYKMTPKLAIWGFPPPIWLPRCWQTGRLPKAPNQVIHIQHQQVLQIRLLCSPMHWIWSQFHSMQRHFLENVIGHIKHSFIFHFLIHYIPTPFIFVVGCQIWPSRTVSWCQMHFMLLVSREEVGSKCVWQWC